MIKKNEVSLPDSCLNKAHDHEMIFVLLQRDAATADTIRFWVQKRIALGKNNPADAQVVEALACADYCDHTIWRPASNA